MPAFTLKTYQSQALDSLRRFLTAARDADSLPDAWTAEMRAQDQPAAVQALPYRSEPFGDVPCVCLRIPTGGGKTLLASHAIALLAREWRAADFPVALWLVPSTIIREQTLRALQTPGHAYRAALESAYGQALMVLDLEAAPTLAPQDFGRCAIVLVATMQSFRVKQTQGRNVYAFSEEFDAHFRYFEPLVAADPALQTGVLERVTQADLDEPGQTFLRPADRGRVKHSLANLLALARPVVIVDEAHNAKTDTTFATLKRIAPCAILELTATPVAKKTNVLYSVTARELEAEDMIKLPVMLAEHAEWQDAVRDAVLRRTQLEAEAVHEETHAAAGGTQKPAYVRPLVLFQAHDKTGAVPPEALRQHLIEVQHIAADEIVIATGEQRGLEGLDLFDRACPVRFVITVEALKEGWDCSFAYVLCSLQNVRSGKDVEQLLGRVLRMPYAQRRTSPALNRAYAYVVARSFAEAAAALADRMVAGMGFEALDAAQMLLPDTGIDGDLFTDAPLLPMLPPAEAVLQIELPAAAADALAGQPDIHVDAWPAADANPDAEAEPQVRITLRGEVSESTLAQVLAATHSADRPRMAGLLAAHQARVQAQRAPAQRGVPFAPLPRLCVRWQGELQLLERETLAELMSFDLLLADPRPELPGFALVEQSDLFEIYMNKARVEWRQARADAAHLTQLTLDAVPAQASEHELLTWLAQTTRRDSLTPAELRAWLALLLANLQSSAGLSLGGLLRARHPLAQAVLRRLDALEFAARQRGFDQLLLPGLGGTAYPGDDAAAAVATSERWRFHFTAGHYPARHAYSGRQQFLKHYFPQIHGLKAQGEEFECAQVIDRHPQVKHWVRNIERQPQFSFWLPTATDYFYPDFVAELLDGRLLVAEYKGEVYATNDDSREKNAIGKAWAAASRGAALFMFVEREVDGLDMTQQLNRALATRLAAG